MQNSGYLDCDTHFTDHPRELWESIAGEVDLPVLPEILDHEGRSRLRIGDELYPKPAGRGQGNPKGLGHLIGPGADDDRRAFMAEHGISAAVLQPGFVGLSVQSVADGRVRRGLLEGYNLLAKRSCERSGLDLRWAALLSAEDPEWSAGLLEQYRDDPNLVGAVVRPTARTAQDRLSGKSFTSVLTALAEQRLVLFVHGGTGCHQWSPLADAYEDYTLTHAFGHMGEHMIALTDLLTRGDGLPPGLRIVMLESGVSWIPGFLGLLDSHVRRLSSSDTAPSEVFAQHFAVVPDPDERHVRWACEAIGRDNILFGSDYPHWDTVPSGKWASTLADFVDKDVLYTNTRRVVPRLAGKGA
ncbi:amidohydrolase family protein [Streptomyces sp. NL15-2K]|uniref:amidohydrolase family protein n=1 Tax=Streptomyces sp. NL15-2K TaxID=376149 RepID=UPI000F575C6D|nr:MULTISPECIES: amidohydrolase family protein [Actinomycetes]WKX10502.1 amidohydrolase family protein [Kutzneria buriramensis]GCB47964.1 hypothetical protein SNL152K_5286 [Streptomyces sp. NL15-2K]